MVKSWGAGCLRQALIAVGVFLVFVAGFVALIVISISLPLTEYQRLVIWLGGVGLIVLLLFSSLLIWGYLPAARRAIILDEAFTPFGLSGKRYLWNGRQYHGMDQGHQVDIYFYRGPSLDIYIEAIINTRLGIGMRGYLGRLASRAANQPRMLTSDPALAHLDIFPLDEAWGRSLLDNPVARSIILQLASPGTGLEFRSLLFQPEAIHLQIHRLAMDSLTAENLRTWVNSMLELAAIATSLPAPTVTAAASALERRTRLNRSDFTLPLVGITFAVVFFLLAILVIVVILYSRLVIPGS